MRDVLRSTTPAKLAGDVRSAFASTDWFTDTAIEGDQMVATVGTVGGGQCLVAYRDGRGAVKFPYIPREWLMPGEIGCHPSVVLAPPL